MTEDSSPAPEPVAPAPLRIMATERANDRYRRFAEGRTITVPRHGVIHPGDVIFTMGSCFAAEIRGALGSHGWKCVPAYNTIAFDPAEALIDTLPDQEHLNYYNTFTMRAQFEESLGLLTHDEDDFWTIGQVARPVRRWEETPNFQDPYRRLVVARSPRKLAELVRRINAKIGEGIAAADAFVFTLGMTEVFRSKRNGRVVCQKPAYAGGGGEMETERHESSFAENLSNMEAIIAMIRRTKPDAPIFISVSPVALERTFSDLDIVTKSIEGKATLRAVAGQLAREHAGVFYFPSFEFVTLQGAAAYRDDFRHVLRPVVEQITSAFIAAYGVNEPRD